MRIYLLISSLLLSINSFSQDYNVTTSNQFELTYVVSALGSGLGMKQPVIKVNGKDFVYTYEQNSYYGEKTEKADTIAIGKIRISSIDSIMKFVKPLGDTTIVKSNICVRSGGVYSLQIKINSSITIFTLYNTFDETVLEVMKILNEYFPKEKKIQVFENFETMRKDCWEGLLKRN